MFNLCIGQEFSVHIQKNGIHVMFNFTMTTDMPHDILDTPILWLLMLLQVLPVWYTNEQFHRKRSSVLVPLRDRIRKTRYDEMVFCGKRST